MNKEGGAWGSCWFWSKLPNIQLSVGRCPRKSPTMKWANMLSLQKKFTEPNTASHNTNRYTNIAGFLEQSASGESLYYKGPTLQQIISDFWVVHPPKCNCPVLLGKRKYCE